MFKRFIICLLAAQCMLIAACSAPSGDKSTDITAVKDDRTWPHPIPCRVNDDNYKELLLMTLGDVQTPLAQGTFYPDKDQVVLNNGRTIENYYKNERGITYFTPLDKTHFALPPSGWCSWYFYYAEINADEVKKNAKWISENLKDYGAEFVQIDDGWQRAVDDSTTRDWTFVHPGTFPDGMDDLAAYIKSVGLVPGLWIAPHGQDNPEVIKKNPNVFLLKEDGTSASSTWEGKYLMDPTTKESKKYFADMFQKFCDWGYDYYKIDGQPIVVTEYGTKKQYMQNPDDDNKKLYRDTLNIIRDVIGKDRYLLGCWGTPIEGVGIMDGSRTGGDIVLGWGGFFTALRATLSGYYLHNIAWYSDPDVLVVRSPMTIDQARLWATTQGLTGQAVLTSDRLMDLSDDRVDILRKVYPAVDIRPVDLFPADSSQSGGWGGSLDAGITKKVWDLKINHLGRRYDVVGVFNFNDRNKSLTYLNWKKLGITGDSPVHVFDFWNEDYLGCWNAGMQVDAAPTSCRVLTLLPDNGRIQLLSTSRHMTQGWVDLVDLQYNEDGTICSGKSRVIKNDKYQMRFAFPKGKNFRIKSVKVKSGNGRVQTVTASHQGWATVNVTPDTTTEISWKVEFEPADFYPFSLRDPGKLMAQQNDNGDVILNWFEQYYLNSGYQVYMDGELLGYTPSANFIVKGLKTGEEHRFQATTVWEDGTESKKSEEIKFTLQGNGN